MSPLARVWCAVELRDCAPYFQLLPTKCNGAGDEVALYPRSSEKVDKLSTVCRKYVREATVNRKDNTRNQMSGKITGNTPFDSAQIQELFY